MKDHIVHKIILQLPANGYEEAQQCQAKARNWSGDTLPKLLQAHLDRLVQTEEIIYLDQFIVELNDYPWNLTALQWESKLTMLFQTTVSKQDLPLVVLRQWFFYLMNGSFERTAIYKSIRETEAYLLQKLDTIEEKDWSGLRWEEINKDVLQRLFSQHSRVFIIQLLSRWLSITAQLSATVYNSITKHRSDFSPDIERIFKQMVKAHQANRLIEKQKMISLLLDPDIYLIMPNGPIGRTAAKSESQKTKEYTAHVHIECPNAGIVLLFPYILRFMEQTGLVEGNKFIDETSRFIAIQSLHFIATGSSTGEEKDYVIPKLLCGLDVKEFVHFSSLLPEPIISEINDLLLSVIEHWGILQHTSIEGLRVSFLQRTGKIIEEEYQYLLQLEESGVDILLDKITWGFRNYRLPWMQKRIISEWY